MPKLNQIIAIEKGIKNRVNEKLSEIYKIFQKLDLFQGHIKTYTPRDEDPSSKFSEKLPDDRRHVQFTVGKLLQTIRETHTELVDVSYLRDSANCSAVADIEVDGKIIIAAAPVTFILWLEKQLNDLHSEIKKTPALDPSEKWTYDADQGLFATAATEQARTKKETMPLVLHPGTKEHPPQVKEITEDVRAGTWRTIKYSGALPADKREEILSRVEKLQRAVKQAREEANGISVSVGDSVGAKIFNFVLDGAV
jgi:hypothetical protein